MRKHMSSSKPQQRGVALIIVLLVVAIVAVVAMSLSERLQTSVLRTANLQQAEQGHWYWVSAETIVRDLLQTELVEDDFTAHLQQEWALQSSSGQRYPVEGGDIQGVIKDQHSCFNVNSMRLPEDQQGLLERRKTQFRMLLMAVLEDGDQYTIDTIVDSTVDWLDEDQNLVSSYGAEDADYESREFPYRTGNTYLAEYSELRLIRGVTPQIYQVMKPYLCMWPNNAKWTLNPNTVPENRPELLYAATLGAMTVDDAQSFLNSRPEEGYESTENLRNDSAMSRAESNQIRPEFGGNVRPDATVVSQLGGALDDLSVKSQYFEVTAQINFGDLTLRGRSFLLIGEEQTRVLYRSIGD
ncbi:type II secretion system minor pseudopilin GspK [Pseudidiomarina aestuarii]|uniref:type II secretion system minor pseudopilin GspK n=1 Tax=Pseudidiomarina aestuarii TaxID=624146 RepID=UPI003A96F797